MAWFSFISDFWKFFFRQNQGNVTPGGGTITNPTNPAEAKMSNKALCVAINDYPGTDNDLSGCIMDGDDWSSIMLSKYVFGNVKKLQNSQATIAAVKAALSALIDEAVAGDVVVFTYSGHGSYVVDKSNDEPDGKDETLYLYDGNLIDDEIRAILDRAKEGVHVTVILDSCHSGTATRVSRPGAPKPRFMPPSDPEVAKLGNIPSSKAMLSESAMKEVLLSGCKSTEYSYDANFGGKPNGALTWTAIKALNKLGNPTYKEWYDEIRKSLPSGQYPQTPQLEGSEENKNRIVFS